MQVLKWHPQLVESLGITNMFKTFLNKADHPLDHHIGDKKTSPEGYVFYHHGKPFKAVDRQELAKANFAKSRD